MDYLTNMPSDIVNEYGISKVLMTRRDTIYMKHVFKNLFVYGNEEWINQKLAALNFKSLFQYMEYITNKLRGIYKITRSFNTDKVDDIVKQDRNSFFEILQMYKQLNPIVILDFDRTITNQNFHSLYRWLIENNYHITINSANPNKD